MSETRLVTCETCKGTGATTAPSGWWRTCPECKGTGSVKKVVETEQPEPVIGPREGHGGKFYGQCGVDNCLGCFLGADR